MNFREFLRESGKFEKTTDGIEVMKTKNAQGGDYYAVKVHKITKVKGTEELNTVISGGWDMDEKSSDTELIFQKGKDGITFMFNNAKEKGVMADFVRPKLK